MTPRQTAEMVRLVESIASILDNDYGCVHYADDDQAPRVARLRAIADSEEDVLSLYGDVRKLLALLGE